MTQDTKLLRRVASISRELVVVAAIVWAVNRWQEQQPSMIVWVATTGIVWLLFRLTVFDWLRRRRAMRLLEEVERRERAERGR